LRNLRPHSNPWRDKFMTVDTLHTLVSGAIWRAEQLDDLGLDTLSAWCDVSRLEEEIAKNLPVKEAEGCIARRGAVRAALKAQDYIRAHDLVKGYITEPNAPASLCTELNNMMKVDTNGLAEEFPFAMKHHNPNEFQTEVNWFQEAGPFGLAVGV